MPDAVILTGATGFVGHAVLAELVARSIPVHAVSRHPGPLIPGVTWHQADLLTAEGRNAIAGLAPQMIHCAWEVEHGKFWTSPANQHWHDASLALIQAFRAQGGTRVLALGTCAEYAAHTPGPWNETREIAPATPYGQAKAALRAGLAEICGESLIWARLFHLYGPREDRRRLIPSLIDALTQGRPATVTSANLIRDVASTAHVARCLVSLLRSPAHGAFDIGSGQPRTLGALAQILAATAGTPNLIHLSHNPGPNDPPAMAPDLARLFAATGLPSEHPEQALPRHYRAETIANNRS